jgi:hypothetical protein
METPGPSSIIPFCNQDDVSLNGRTVYSPVPVNINRQGLEKNVLSQLHLSFTSSLKDLRLKNPRHSSAMPAAFCSQIFQIQCKSKRLSGHNIFSEALTLNAARNKNIRD